MKLTALLLACTAVAGCASAGAVAEDNATGRGNVFVAVDNEGFADQAVYLYSGGAQSRIGLVTGLTQQVLRIGRERLSDETLTISTRSIGGGVTGVSETLTVPGSRAAKLVITAQRQLILLPGDWADVAGKKR